MNQLKYYPEDYESRVMASISKVKGSTVWFVYCNSQTSQNCL